TSRFMKEYALRTSIYFIKLHTPEWGTLFWSGADLFWIAARRIGVGQIRLEWIG
ncbi:hypothetical protein NDU88_006134, partial [Pleurodeles waltl]